MTSAAVPARAQARPIDVVIESEMGPVTSRVYLAADGSTGRVVYALHGMESIDNGLGWDTDTDLVRILTSANVNVVVPQNGRTSFFTDWKAPSSPGLGCFSQFLPEAGSAEGAQSLSADTQSAVQERPYRWETVLTRDLPNALQQRFGLSPVGNAVVGVSMGGLAALNLAAHHPRQFSYAASLSGFPHISSIFLPEAMRLAVAWKGSLNIDCMWGPPWNALWRRNDPYEMVDSYVAANTRLYLGSCTGELGPADRPATGDIIFGGALEATADANTRLFQEKLTAIGYTNVAYDFWSPGIHSWPYWRDHTQAMTDDLLAHFG
ncbi:alpha/beta hydrolase [Nocardia crassostreae]|uniref:alpha/beta hydrolase n=1 Tax=Nocardia crassostreae TaxID=53428 RepID=UPI0012F9DF2D|nr:alpha/beta hydrolase family protein [Nocardia crassostreae]